MILLPVVIMAIVAVTAIIRDRAMVENEARQRAGEILQQINQGFGDRLAGHLSDYELCLPFWRDENWNEKVLRPGDSSRSIFEKEKISLAQRLDNLPGSIPLSFVGEAAIKFTLAFDRDGALRQPPGDSVPRPPQWRLEFAPEQLAAWNSLEEAVADSTNPARIETAWREFSETKPPVEALADAEFLRLQANLRAEPASNAIPQLLRFSEHCHGDADAQGTNNRRWKNPITESGIPLSSLALAEALKRAPETAFPEALWRDLLREVFTSPSLFTPVLLNLAEPLTHRDPALAESLRALRGRWEATSDAWDFAGLIRQRVKLQSVTTTNFWLDFAGARWFCLLQSSASGTNTPASGISARVFPLSEVLWAVEHSIQETGASMPEYFSLTAELSGLSPIPIAKTSPASANPGDTVLARVEGDFALPPEEINLEALRDSPFFETMQSNYASRLSKAATKANLTLAGDPLPGQPHYVLRILLADRNLMLAAHHQRMLRFGALILASAIAAIIGFLAARRAFRRQLHLSEMKSNFVSSVSHELRAPIASVRLMAEGLERGKIRDPGKQHEYFRFIVQECRRLSSLIENVLDFSRIEQGRKEYEFEPTDVAALAEQTVRLMNTYADERQIRIMFHVKGGPLPVEMDGKAIQQALVNLIDNAIKHSVSGSTITVGLDFENAALPQAGQATRQVHLWVEDHGEGIPPEEHERIFERFYRLGSELRRETQGVGIGLSIVKHIVEAHGGKIIVRSAPGQGSRFTIVLPLIDDQKTPDREGQP